MPASARSAVEQVIDRSAGSTSSSTTRPSSTRRRTSTKITRGAARAHVPHQHLRLFLHDAGGAAALEKGAAIVNTSSVTAYRGSPQLLDYSATKGAIVAFTRSLAKALVEKGIRVNGVAPGPIWTPLIPSTFPAEKVASFGADRRR